jgi:hypothetical protein
MVITDIIDKNFRRERIVHPLRLKKLSSIMNENHTLGIFNSVLTTNITKPYNIDYTSKSNIGGVFLKHLSRNENTLKCVFTRIDVNKFILEIPKDKGVDISYIWRRTISGDILRAESIKSISVDKKVFIGVQDWPEVKRLDMGTINYQWSNIAISKMTEISESNKNIYSILVECEYTKEVEWVILP